MSELDNVMKLKHLNYLSGQVADTIAAQKILDTVPASVDDGLWRDGNALKMKVGAFVATFCPSLLQGGLFCVCTLSACCRFLVTEGYVKLQAKLALFRDFVTIAIFGYGRLRKGKTKHVMAKFHRKHLTIKSCAV